MNIEIRGAHCHNLRAVSVDIPRNGLVVVTGVSGSGKSSLVFDTIAAAAQREYFESLSSYARRSLPRFPPPEADRISGLSPCIVIDQRPMGHNIRSTVGTATEVYTLLRLLYSRIGVPVLRAGDFSFNTLEGACRGCDGVGVKLVPDLDRLIDLEKSLDGGAIQHRTWRVGSRYWNIIKASDLFNMKIPVNQFEKDVLNCLLYAEPKRLTNDAPGYMQSFSLEGIVRRLLKRQDDKRGLDSNDYDRRFFKMGSCEACHGSRINERAQSVHVSDKTIAELSGMEIPQLIAFLMQQKGVVAETVVPQMVRVLQYLVNAGAAYLTIGRSVNTLSGGESQRVKLARQLGGVLTEIVYVMDEPTIGLHPRDVDRLVSLLLELRSRPNTVLVVEHDRSIIERADYIVELGPGAGSGGGRIVALGSPAEVSAIESPTGLMLRSSRSSSVARPVRQHASYFNISRADLNNLKLLNISIPKGVLVCITGVSGSGKTSLTRVMLAQYPEIVEVDQSPIARSSRSIIATYVGAFDGIRQAFSKASGRKASLFAFNGAGACAACKGLGQITMDMHFLGNIRSPCDVCGGTRYRAEILRDRLRNKTIAEVLNLTVDQAMGFFTEDEVKSRIGLLSEVGLGYLKLGQSLDSLSGGELQRSKLASRLHGKGQAYCLDEPTRGLHRQDVERLIGLMDRLVKIGNSVIVVEHDIDVISAADWVIDLGPDGGTGGGRIVVQGPPAEVAAFPASYTGQYLARSLRRGDS
jgi:excinuclease UvrABC ATPase subunit